MNDEKKTPWLPPGLWLASGIPLIIIGVLAGFVAALVFNLPSILLWSWAWFWLTVSGVVMVIKKGKISRSWNFVGQSCVVIGIVGMLSSLILGNICTIPTEIPENKLTIVRLKMIQIDASAYMLDLKRLPPTVNKEFVKALCQGGDYMRFAVQKLNADGEVLDEWGTPLRINANADESLTFSSAGKDKKFGTKDDLSATTPTLPTLTVTGKSGTDGETKQRHAAGGSKK